MEKLKEQTFLVKYFSKDGEYLDFFRHGCKKLSTVLARERKWVTSCWARKYTDDTVMLVYQPDDDDKDNLILKTTKRDFLDGQN